MKYNDTISTVIYRGYDALIVILLINNLHSLCKKIRFNIVTCKLRNKTGCGRACFFSYAMRVKISSEKRDRWSVINAMTQSIFLIEKNRDIRDLGSLSSGAKSARNKKALRELPRRRRLSWKFYGAGLVSGTVAFSHRNSVQFRNLH